MKISDAELFGYRLPFKKPLTLGNSKQTHREGLIIKLSSEFGYYGFGETAPLQGFSNESLDDATAQIQTVLPLLIRKNQEITYNRESEVGNLAKWLDVKELYPSVICGLEMALLNLVAATRSISISVLMNDNSMGTIRLNSLITGEHEKLTEKAREIRREGYRAVKLKVGRKDIAIDIERTRTVSSEIGSVTVLRLDANQAWTFDEALEFADGIRDCKVDYIEEPLIEYERLQEFSHRTSIPVALDESLTHYQPLEIPQFKGLEAIIIKPTILGGMEKAVAYLKETRLKGPKAVVSSTFESSVGIAALAHLAAAHARPNVASGLDTSDLLGYDLFETPLDTSGGRFKIAQVTRSEQTIRLEKLTPIPI